MAWASWKGQLETALCLAHPGLDALKDLCSLWRSLALLLHGTLR